MGAREVTPQEAPELHAMIERLCIQADLPKPKIAVAQTNMPNAFALGRSQKSATVCATTGIMNLLSPAELEGVMAHELAHVKNRDVAIMTIASFFASIAAMILQFGFLFGGGGHSDDDDGPGIFAIIIFSLIVYVVSFFLMMALSRYREFVRRPRRGARHRPPERAGLGAAQDLLGHGQAAPAGPARRQRAERVLHRLAEEGRSPGLFSTHPPMEQRIERLMQYEARAAARHARAA